jgi:putative ABC transport system permease protein
MLKLKNITKVYNSGNEKLKALDNVEIMFRKSEFVSILGPSGCGKTTLLNIIGGLDRYTSGDLIINGKSTKYFKDRDWDSYRNYSVGFVFQNYNLIGHQTVLSNVELALTISGVSKKERRKRAIKALEEVGLKNHINKKPNQLSGGQMQRVAIARALVNNPDIILADEPTGALDTKTSIQVMEILKNISKDKLVIMVTHNPDLAQKYSSRIIKILDGKIIDDSNILKEATKEEKAHDNKRRTSMKFLTALHLSLNNLMTKKGRTILTSFAGSIGIIGIALILAISTGVQNYINKVEEDTLSSYPLTIEESTIDMSSMIDTMMGENKNSEKREEGKIYSSDIMNDLIASLSSKISTNNLKALKEYIESDTSKIRENSNAIKYSYNLDINLYKSNTDDGIVKVNPSTVMETLGMTTSNPYSQMMPLSSMMGNNNVWEELIDNDELLKSQYNLLAGSWPTKYNEVVLIVGKNNEISDYTLYSLGLKDQNELKSKMKAIQNGETVEPSEETVYSYDDLLNLSYKLVLNSDYYVKTNNLWIDKSEDDFYMKQIIKDAEEIKVVGIIKQNDSSTTTSKSGQIGYTSDLTKYVINKTNSSDIVKTQKENKEINIFTGLEFPKDELNSDFDYNSLSEVEKIKLGKLNSDELAELMKAYRDNKNSSYESNLIKLGSVDISSPASISIYPKNFASKNNLIDIIEEYNKTAKDNNKEENIINYTDVIGTMMKSVSQIINTISYVLIAFVAISLVVSSIMIGIITYISVLERTKEIGILRAIGASKKDISRVFNAETLIVGFISGVIGILITMLLTLPINSLIYMITGVSIITKVPLNAAIILVIISMLLTIVAGLIPSRIASKKDPVVALRTE